MPSRLAPPIPAKKLSGIDMTRAQGQDITRKVSALYVQSVQADKPPVPRMVFASGGRTASARAERQTAGV